MKKIYLFALSFIALPVLADNTHGFYAGVGISGVKNELDTVGTEHLRAVELLGGYKYNDALGVELRLGNGFSNGSSSTYINSSGATVNGNLERDLGNYQSIYYKPELINDEAKLYALLGYTHLSSSVKISDTNGALVSKKNDSFSGYSYGLGVSFVLSSRVNINIEYKTICDELNNKPDTASVNFDYRF